MKKINLIPSKAINLPTEYGDFKMMTFENPARNGEPSFALIRGDFSPEKETIVRVHSECLTGDLFHSKRCDCGSQLKKALSIISEKGGLLVYLRQEGRGIGLTEKIRTYYLQENGADTVEANILLGYEPDLRDYSEAAEILTFFSIKKVRLLTNNPDKVNALSEAGFKVTREDLVTEIHKYNRKYLSIKKEKMGHLLAV